jgi:8-oxo-dGTP pyrophosphatase MutT (NUDIX family)
MKVEEVSSRLAVGGTPGRRRSPRSAGDDGRLLDGWQSLRGDHDLNPDYYDPDQTLRPAAVLIPIVEREAGLTLLFTRRTDHLDAHAGQISFPGGQIEVDDADPVAAALRETEEEVGIEGPKIRPIGRLDTYITRTGFEVTPVVGLVRPPFTVEPDRFEVAEVFEAPLDFFLVPENRGRHSRVFEGAERHFYVFEYRDYFIWGATAGMLVNLVEVLKPPRP